MCLGADIAFGADEPPMLEALLQAEPPDGAAIDDGGLSGEMRGSAMRAAALTFGSRAGLARRGWEIAAMLERHAHKLSAVYRFRDLMLEKDGFTVMPPVLAETDRAFRLRRDGARAASARRVVRIVEPERIVSAVPHWREFLVREWSEAVLPAAVLFPRSSAEVARWQRWGARGMGAWRRARRRHLRRRPRPSQTGCSRGWCSGAGLTWREWSHRPRSRRNASLRAATGSWCGSGRPLARLGPPARFELRPRQWKALPYTPSGGNTPAGGHTPAGGGTPSDGGTPSGGDTQ